MFEWIFSLFRPKNIAAQKVSFDIITWHEQEKFDSLIKKIFL